mmetsp:Transcript_26552/g.76677  ORF Transcript_26552/g.76677 Transcript_26552/m.76677 type:complete len:320 (+) Transcript_26552:49-1008(+)
MTPIISHRRRRRRRSRGLLTTTTTIACAAILVPSNSNGSFAHALSKSILSGPTKCPEVQKVIKGSFVRLHYTGTIAENSKSGVPGTEFDSSYDTTTSAAANNNNDKPQPFETQVGVGKLIKGWDLGLLGLCLGTRARLIIPPSQAYGERGAPPNIPPGATLQFEVEIVDIANYKDRQVVVDVPPGEGGGDNLFALIDANRDGKLDADELQHFFYQQGSDTVPPEVWREDQDEDGVISWIEFSGPKGDGPPNMEDTKKKMEEQDRLKEEERKRLEKEARQIPDEELTPAAAVARRKLRAKRANRKRPVNGGVDVQGAQQQ